jgi:alpha-tubulin suppressor-like RCC1 family protein
MVTNWRQYSLQSNGTLWALGGQNSSGQLGLLDTTNGLRPVQIGTGSNWNRLHCGYGGFTLALQSDGTLWAWGYGFSGNLGNNSTSNFPVQNTSRNRKQLDKNKCLEILFLSALQSNGTLWAWGNNRNGELGLSDTFNRYTTCTSR